jgi:deoxycytidine triphosphate deaminase
MRDEKVIGNLEYEFCDNIDEAKLISQRYRLKDPLADIRPSLLNRHDIIKYVSKTGMVFPFSTKQLKSASYEVCFGKEAIYWDADGKHSFKATDAHSYLVLKKNSIAYVDVDISFFLPFYIAVRFNLTITHVHRGILLGTGPLVDPGFCGKLMIPLHNLTNNDYELHPGEPLITVEFTKLTPDELLQSREKYKITEKEIKDWYSKNIKEPDFDFNKYFKRALPLGIGQVQSSLSDTLNNVQALTEDYKKKVKHAYVAWMSVGIALVALFYMTFTVVSDANKYVSDATTSINGKNHVASDILTFATKDDLNELRSNVAESGSKINQLFERVSSDDVKKQVVQIRSDIKDLESRIRNIESAMAKVVEGQNEKSSKN